MKRDLGKDLELTNRATPGPWYTEECFSPNCWCKVIMSSGEKDEGGEDITVAPSGCLYKDDAELIAQAREGWPHAIDRAIKVEALARELVDMLGRVTPCYTEGRLGIDLDAVYEVNRLLKKAKEVLGIVRVKKHGSRLKKGGGCG